MGSREKNRTANQCAWLGIFFALFLTGQPRASSAAEQRGASDQPGALDGKKDNTLDKKATGYGWPAKHPVSAAIKSCGCGDWTLDELIRQGDIEAIKETMHVFGPGIDAATYSGIPFIHLASATGRSDLVGQLIRNGARYDVRAPD